MQIFSLPNGPLTVERNGQRYLADEWHKTWTDFWQQAQRELGNEGYLIPQQPSATVDLKTGVENIGNLVYDTGRSALIVNINGALYKLEATLI